VPHSWKAATTPPGPDGVGLPDAEALAVGVVEAGVGEADAEVDDAEGAALDDVAVGLPPLSHAASTRAAAAAVTIIAPARTAPSTSLISARA
jgi:hypothetical protein